MLNFLLVPIPAIVSMLLLWVQVTCLDNLPRGAYAEQRKERQRAMVFLALTLVLMAVYIYTLPDILLAIEELAQLEK